MAKVYSIDDVIPVIDPSAFVHEDAILIGDVIVGPGCYVGPCACLRGDFGQIRLGSGVNVQDTCVIHATPWADVVIEEDGHIGHGAILHACTIRHNAMVGMNAVVMDEADIGENTIVAASSFVKTGMIVPANMLVAGTPAKIVRSLNEKEILGKIRGTKLYHALRDRSSKSMRRVEPLQSEERNRPRVQPLNESLSKE